MDESELYARFQHLRMRICTMKIGNYCERVQGEVAEYFEVRRVLYGR